MLICQLLISPFPPILSNTPLAGKNKSRGIYEEVNTRGIVNFNADLKHKIEFLLVDEYN